ncbi:MAG: hypothetical protein WCH34_05220 [Bacteroidota bacterium]
MRNFYQEVSLLKPENETEKINKAKLKEIIFTAIGKMSAEINTISYKKPTTVVFEMLLRIQEQLIKLFKNKGSDLKHLLNAISQQYCQEMQDNNDSFVFVFSNRLKAIEIEDKEKIPRKTCLVCIRWRKEEEQLDVLSWWLKKDFVIKPLYIRKIFGNTNTIPVLDCRPKRLKHFSLLARKLHFLDFIEEDSGICFMQVLSRYIICNGKPVSAHRLNNLATEAARDPEIVKFIDKIIKDIQHAATSKNEGK